MSGFVAGYVVPTWPQPLLTPDANPGYRRLRTAYETARDEIARSGADLLVLYSTRWPCVIGHQIQADPEPTWTLVDEEFHELGSIPYKLRIDAAFAATLRDCAEARGLHARTVAYRGFPIDPGSVTALQLLDPDNRIPATIVSCNMYADRAETLVLGKAVGDAVAATGRRAVAVSVTALSNRMFHHPIDPTRDRISSRKDDEWNRKILEFFEAGRLEDVSQLARTFTREANADSRFKAIWWLAAAMGQHNGYDGKVLAYEPVWGTGCAVIGLYPNESGAAELEFDEDDVDVYQGDRNVLSGEPTDGEAADATAPPRPVPAPRPAVASSQAIDAADAPRPVGAYPHARRVGDLLYLSGMGPRQPGTDAIPGGPIRDAAGNPLPYDAAAQTEAVIANLRTVLAASGASLDHVIDVSVFLVDMDRDFAAFNEVYRKHFEGIGATRTTVAVTALPTPIAVELKVVARL